MAKKSLPKILNRRSTWLRITSKAENSKDRLRELMDDEEKFYGWIFRYTEAIRIPEIPDFFIKGGLSDSEINHRLLELTQIRHSIDDIMGKCNLHIVYLNQKIFGLKNSPGIEGLKATEMGYLLASFKDNIKLYNRIQSTLKSKLLMISNNLAAIKLLSKNIRAMRKK